MSSPAPVVAENLLESGCGSTGSGHIRDINATIPLPTGPWAARCCLGRVLALPLGSSAFGTSARRRLHPLEHVLGSQQLGLGLQPEYSDQSIRLKTSTAFRSLDLAAI